MDKQLVWFETLYDTYADAIWRHIYHRLGDRERAKELMHDVFLKAWQYVQQGNTIEHEKAFLYRIAKNLFINEIRIKKQVTSLDIFTEAGLEIEDTITKTDTQAEHTELLERLKLLKDTYQSVLIMRYIDDLSVKEIATLLQEKETNISMRIKRAIEALKQTYNHHPQPS